MIDIGVDRKVKKLDVYTHILNFGLIYLKNHLSQPLIDKTSDKKSIYIAELLHLIPSRLHTEEFDQFDVEFLEYGLKYFVEKYPSWDAATFLTMMDAGLELYESVKSNYEISWKIPEELVKKIETYRVNNRDN